MDGTVIMLYSGNFAFFAIRHRQSRTLFLSQLIDTRESDPPFMRVAVGAVLAAYDDAVDRVSTPATDSSETHGSLASDDVEDDDGAVITTAGEGTGTTTVAHSH